MHHTIRLDRRRLLAGLVLAFAARPTCAQPPDANTLFNDGVNLLFAGKPKESAEAFDALVKLPRLRSAKLHGTKCFRGPPPTPKPIPAASHANSAKRASF